MPSKWDDLPNGPLLRALLEMAKKYKDAGITTPLLPGVPIGNATWKAVDETTSALGRFDIWYEWRYRLQTIFNHCPEKYDLLYDAGLADAGLALIAWDEAGELWKLTAEQLRLTLQLLPESDWRHSATLLLLPLKEYLDAEFIASKSQ